SEAEDENPTAVDGTSVRIQRFGGTGYNIVGHGRVDLTGELDEAGVLAKLPRLPGEIEGINGNAMPAQTGAGIKRHKPERLGFGRSNHFPDINAHRRVNHLQFIDQR